MMFLQLLQKRSLACNAHVARSAIGRTSQIVCNQFVLQHCVRLQTYLNSYRESNPRDGLGRSHVRSQLASIWKLHGLWKPPPQAHFVWLEEI